jgi:hypothetical protein
VCAAALQAARLEAQRAKQLYPYSCDGSSWARPAWASYDSLMAPQVRLAAAAWLKEVCSSLHACMHIWSWLLCFDLQEAPGISNAVALKHSE